MQKGKVKDYDSSRGFGSIIDFATGQCLTVYANYVNLKAGETLNKGQEVVYEIEHKRNENWAVNVKIA